VDSKTHPVEHSPISELSHEISNFNDGALFHPLI
jgi:hypothetical protein